MPIARLQDGLSRPGAHALAAKIKNHWIMRKFPLIQTWVEEIKHVEYLNEPIFVVRSNMVRGYPPRA